MERLPFYLLYPNPNRRRLRPRHTLTEILDATVKAYPEAGKFEKVVFAISYRDEDEDAKRFRVSHEAL